LTKPNELEFDILFLFIYFLNLNFIYLLIEKI
jgi:hypothetical protein